MTRGNARELAIHLIYGREFTGDTPIETVRLRLEEGYYEQLAAEYEIYTERPTPKQVKYLEDLVAGVHAHEELLNVIIGKYSAEKRYNPYMRWRSDSVSRPAGPGSIPPDSAGSTVEFRT